MTAAFTVAGTRARPGRRRVRSRICNAVKQQEGLILSGRDVSVDGEPAFGPLVSGPVLNRFIRDEWEEWMMHVTFRPPEAVDGQVVPGKASGFVGSARSGDGVRWDIAKAALKPNKDDWWYFDTAHCAVGDVQIMSSDVIRAAGGVYFMYFHGGDEEVVDVDGQDVKGFKTRIGVAISLDGQNWSRIEGSNANGSVLDLGPSGCFDEKFVAGPQVLKLNDEYRMYYHSRDPRTGRYGVGIAVSKTGVDFKRAESMGLKFKSGPASFFANGISNRHIVQDRNGTFHMFFEGISEAGESSIGLAQSSDGLSWSLSHASAVLVKGPEGSWDDAGVSHPRAVIMDDASIRLYYTGVGKDSGECGVGLAVSNGTNWTDFARHRSQS
mmetsp:Transcript_11311/g.34626  ORF Transcript_11311/g.34626 Transcript_11311/m.34626 type:complete len:381 (+) Transcript_11311:77-1219(+)